MTSGPAAVRAAHAADEGAWLEMWADFVRDGPEPCAPDAPALTWRRVLDAASPLDCLIAEEHGAPIGFLLYVTHPYSWSTRAVCYLLDLYVRPDHRGRGHGRALLEALDRTGRTAGWLKIYWMTQADNRLSQALYDKLATRSPLVRYDLYLAPH